MKIYITVVACGYGDEHYTNIIYVGFDYSEAINPNKFYFQSEYNQFVNVETWLNGVKIKETTIFE